MAELLKDSFGPEVPEYIADFISAAHPELGRSAFIAACLDGYDELELMARATHISDALAEHLPDDREAALQIVIDALAAELERVGGIEELVGMTGFRYMPLTKFVGDHGLDHFELAMTAQYELTQRFTAEFSIRPYLEQHRDATLERLREWTSDPSEHVRRLVSEGTRPRLPWGSRLREFMADPAPVVDLVERLRDDESEYVRRSVANNINDIAKDHPDVAIDIARRWWPAVAEHDADRNRRRLIKHALRTLIKQGDPEALDVIGYGPNSPIEVATATIEPAAVAIGSKVRLEVELLNPTKRECAGLVDIVVHFVKANGSTSPKVFKGAEVEMGPGETAKVRKTVSLKQHTTRTHYPGEHRIDVLINGRPEPIGSFTIQV